MKPFTIFAMWDFPVYACLVNSADVFVCYSCAFVDTTKYVDQRCTRETIAWVTTCILLFSFFIQATITG